MGGGLHPDLGPRMLSFSQNPKETGVDIEYVKAQGRSGSIFLEMGRGRRPLAAGQRGNQWDSGVDNCQFLMFNTAQHGGAR